MVIIDCIDSNVFIVNYRFDITLFVNDLSYAIVFFFFFCETLFCLNEETFILQIKRVKDADEVPMVCKYSFCNLRTYSSLLDKHQNKYKFHDCR